MERWRDYRCMGRLARAVAAGVPHHVTQRGNGRRDVFVSDGMQGVYLSLWREHAANNGLRVLGYCLMSNHVHLVVVPEDEDALGRGIRRIHGRFAQFWNSARGGSGHMWENRFFSCPVAPQRVWAVMRYVELNPVRAGMVDDAVAYPWSSAVAHVSGVDRSGVLDLNWWSREWDQGCWRAALEAGPGSGVDAIRRATQSGRPFGEATFVEELEKRLGRPLAPRPRGRPKKVAGEVMDVRLAAAAGSE